MKGSKQWQSRVLSILLTIGIFCLLGWQLAREWHNLPPEFFQGVGIPWLLGSLVVLTIALLLVSFRWWVTLRAIGVPIGWWIAVQVWFLSQAGRYVPGGVWSYVARFYLGKNRISQQAIVTSMILETGLRVVSEVFVFVLSLPLWPDRRFLTAEITLLLTGGVALGLVLIHPVLLRYFGKFELLRRMGLGMENFSGLRYRVMLAMLLYYMLSVLTVGGAFFLLVEGFYPVPLHLFPAVAGSLAASVVLGFLVPFAPNGWGVQEGMLAFLLSRIMPLSVSIVIAMTARAWLIIGEAFWILVALGAWREKYPLSGIDRKARVS